MKYTKIITSLFLAAVFMLSSSAMAADKGKKGGRKNPYAELGLSKDQQKDMAALRKEVSAAMKKAREAKDRDGMKAAQKKMQDGLAKILNEEQMDKYKKLQAEMRKNRGGKGKGQKGGDKRKKKKDSDS